MSSSSEGEFLEDCLLICAATAACLNVNLGNSNKPEKCKKKPKYHVNPYLRERRFKGRFTCALDDIVGSLHMSPEVFEELLFKINPHIKFKAETRPGESISPKEKLACCLEYLVNGNTQGYVASLYRISKQYFSAILEKICDAIYDILKNEIPEFSEENFVKIANDYNLIWDFPNTIGSLDGRHIEVRKHKKSDNHFYNNKDNISCLSIALLGVADAHYRFSYVDVDICEPEKNDNYFINSKFAEHCFEDSYSFPTVNCIGNVAVPYFFIADDTFLLHKRIIKPFEPANNKKETFFNFRLNRAKRCIENTFGILSQRWMCLSKPLLCEPFRAQKIVKACCYLHNYLLRVSKSTYCPVNFADSIESDGNVIEGQWRKSLNKSFNNNKFSTYQEYNYFAGEETREYLTNYFSSKEDEYVLRKKM